MSFQSFITRLAFELSVRAISLKVRFKVIYWIFAKMTYYFFWTHFNVFAKLTVIKLHFSSIAFVNRLNFIQCCQDLLWESTSLCFQKFIFAIFIWWTVSFCKCNVYLAKLAENFSTFNTLNWRNRHILTNCTLSSIWYFVRSKVLRIFSLRSKHLCFVLLQDIF